MTWEEYRDWALSKREGKTSVMALGLAGECGEVVDLVKKIIFHHRPLSAQVVDEAGDLFFYYSMILSDFGLTLDEVMERNIEKLNKRYPSGWVPGGGNRQED